MKIFSTAREALFLLTNPALWFRRPLELVDLQKDPVEQFRAWFDQAGRSWRGEFHNWLCLSTIDRDGYPHGRIVLLKEYDERGFVFYTNTNSQKGQQLGGCPKASMTFYWEHLQHQIRIVGDIERVADEQADTYFSGRPRKSQLGAWASEQSTPLASRQELVERLQALTKEYRGREVPRPPHWTGYRLKPIQYEFWELRLSRLHDRFMYTPATEPGSWTIQQLAP